MAGKCKRNSTKGGSSVADGPKCANDGCGKPGSHLCSRCRTVSYCSAACQKVHWKEGDHKQECVPAAATRDSPPTSVAAAAVVGGAVPRRVSDVRACTICLESDPPPIQSGCACRGDAGLAHVECRAEAAAHRMANTKKQDGWSTCATCGQPFTGAMQMGLADEWRSRSRHLPEEVTQRLGAACNLGNAYFNQGRYAESETIHRKALAVYRRVLRPDDPRILTTSSNLALAMKHQGKNAKAMAIYRDVLPVQRRVLGPDHPDTLLMASNMAAALDAQGKRVEAETIYREVLAVQQRVLGSEHPSTLLTAGNLALSLKLLGKHAEANAINRETLLVQRRVLGPEHPNTVAAAVNLACALKDQGEYAEAEMLCAETLEIQRRLLGPNHPYTLATAIVLDSCARAARAAPS
jgi:tetratricopeptide (TPR) repeat protein